MLKADRAVIERFEARIQASAVQAYDEASALVVQNETVGGYMPLSCDNLRLGAVTPPSMDAGRWEARLALRKALAGFLAES